MVKTTGFNLLKLKKTSQQITITIYSNLMKLFLVHENTIINWINNHVSQINTNNHVSNNLQTNFYFCRIIIYKYINYTPVY